MNKVYTPKQREFMRLWQKNKLKRINLLEGSVRSGKTWISLVLWAFWVATMPKDKNYLMIAKTLTSLRRNCLDLLQDLVGAKYFTYSLSKKEGGLFGRKIYLEGVNDARAESKIRGMTLIGAYCDELTLFTEDFFAMLLSRLSEKGAKIIATTNPDSPNHWLMTKYINRIEEDGLDMYVEKFLIDDNTFLDKDYVDNLKKEYTGVFYDRFILGMWKRAEGIVFRDFSENTNKYLINSNDAPKKFDVLDIGFDIGGNGSAYAITATGQTSDGFLYVLSSRKKQAKDLPMSEVENFAFDFINKIERKYGRYIDCVNCDHSDVIINTLNEKRYIFGKTYKPPLEDRPFLFSVLMAKGKIKFVKEECGDLIDELKNLTYDAKKEKPIVLDDGSMQIDAWDSLTYSISRTWHYLTEEMR